jgi:hypothetical protein
MQWYNPHFTDGSPGSEYGENTIVVEQTDPTSNGPLFEPRA